MALAKSRKHRAESELNRMVAATTARAEMFRHIERNEMESKYLQSHHVDETPRLRSG